MEALAKAVPRSKYITVILGSTVSLIRQTVFCEIFCLLLLSQTLLFASPEAENDRPAYSFEFLTFKSGYEDKAVLEIWGEIPAQQLRFIGTSFGFLATFQVSAILFNPAGLEVDRSTVADRLLAHSRDEARKVGPALVKLSFILPPGDYSTVIRVKDLQSTSSHRIRKKIKIPDYGAGFSVSDLQLSTSIERTKEQSRLTKNSWRIVPNPSRQFGGDNRSVFIYLELYNLEFGASEIEKGVLSTFTIRDKNNQAISSSTIPNIKVGDHSTLVALIPVRHLLSGQYRMVVVVKDLGTGQEVDRAASFFVPNSDLIAESL